MLIGECPKCDAVFDGGGLSDESKAQIADGTHPGTLCPACKEKGYLAVGVVKFEYEAERDTAIEERTEARAELFRAQERVRELEDQLFELGSAELARQHAVESGVQRRHEYFQKVEYEQGVILNLAVTIATKRREGK